MDSLLPLVQRKLKEHQDLCAKHGLYFKVVSTYRSLEEQTKLYNRPFDKIDNDKDGKVDEADEKVTNAKAGQSFHNWKCAYDIAPLVKGKVVYDEAIMFAIGYYGQKVGLTWGGEFKKFPDYPHFELTLGYTFNDFINNKVDYNKFK